MTLNRQWRMHKRPTDLVSKEHFSFNDTELRPINEGEFLVRNLYLSFDPTLRVWMNEKDSYVSAIKIDEVMRGTTVAEVVESKHDNYQVGDKVLGGFGWQDYAISDGEERIIKTQKIPSHIPPTLPLSVLGVTGITAYFGITEIAKVKSGETVLVSGAAGATGSIAGQIAKLKGANVIGLASTKEKCEWLTQQAGFDHAINYKDEDVSQALKTYCPQGIDVYFDNVGGEILDKVLAQININARVVLCGAISSYNSEKPYALKNTSNLIVQRGTMQGFIVLDYLARANEAMSALLSWIQTGELVFQEDIQQGLENAPETFQRIFTGKNQGKQLLKIADAKY
jgi:NADPH-dependent curcumin reductase CurA